jgi:GTP cyclohydrolase I
MPREGRIESRFTFFVRKRAPVSGLSSLPRLPGPLDLRDAVPATTLWTEVGVPVKSLCPCSKEISDYGAHNQRSLDRPCRVRAAAGGGAGSELDALRRGSACSEIWPMLKRADEKWMHRARLREPEVRRGPGARRRAGA